MQRTFAEVSGESPIFLFRARLPLRFPVECRCAGVMQTAVCLPLPEQTSALTVQEASSSFSAGTSFMSFSSCSLRM